MRGAYVVSSHKQQEFTFLLAADERVFAHPKRPYHRNESRKSSLTDNDLCGSCVCFGEKFAHLYTHFCTWVEVVCRQCKKHAIGYFPVFFPGPEIQMPKLFAKNFNYCRLKRDIKWFWNMQIVLLTVFCAEQLNKWWAVEHFGSISCFESEWENVSWREQIHSGFRLQYSWNTCKECHCIRLLMMIAELQWVKYPHSGYLVG